MLGLLNILEHEYLSKKGWSIGSVEIGLSSLKGRQFEIDSMNAYRFITTEIPAAYKCMPIFDRLNKKIDFVTLESLGKDLNIELNLRNFVNSIDITDQNDDYYNRFRVTGNDPDVALLEYINYGSDKLDNLDYAIANEQLSPSTIEKYNAYKKFIEDNRNAYANYTKEYLKLEEERSNLYDLEPVEEVDVMFTNLTDDELQMELEHAQAVLDLLEEIHTVDGVLQIEGTNDYALYISTKDVIIPNIEAEIAARAEGKHADPIDYTTNWELYGINELERKKKAYQAQIDVLTEAGYDKEWVDSNESTGETTEPQQGVSKDAHDKQHALYLKYVGYVEEIDARLAVLNQRVAEIDSDIEVNNTAKNELAAKAKLEHPSWGFTDNELMDINIIYRDSDFKDTTIEVLDTDTIDDIISLAWDLYNSAKEQLEIESHPQMSYKISLDNLFKHAKFAEKANSICIGDFCYLGLDNGFHTKQRIVEMSLELINFNDNDVEITFSDMTTVCGKADDYRYILENNNSSSKNSITRSQAKYLETIATTVAAKLLSKYINGGSSVFPNGISQEDLMKLQDALNGLIEGELTLEELKVKLAQIDTLEADCAFIKFLNATYLVAEQAEFKELKSEVATINSALIGTSATETGIIINLTSENATINEALIKSLIAQYITVGDLKAGNINIASEDGVLQIVDNTIFISDANGNTVVQLGQDAKGNYGLIITDENGAILLDSQGLHEGIVPSQFIKSSMIGDGEVGNSKIDWASISNGVDEDGKPVWDAHSVQINGEGLDVVYSTMTEDIDKNTTSIEKANITIDQLSKEIGLVVSGDTYTSKISTMESDIADASIGINKWLIEIYPKSTLPEENRDLIDFSAFYGENIIPAYQYLVDDTKLTTDFGYGVDYIGYALTFIQFDEDITSTVVFNKATKGTIYLNGIRRNDNSGTTANENVIIPFKSGWNVVEVIWSVDETSDTDGFSFDVNISKMEKSSLMNCYYKTITGRECSITTQSASIQIGLQNITSRVENVTTQLDQKAESDEVRELHNQYTEVQQNLENYKITVSDTYATNEGLETLNQAVINIQNNMITNVVNSEEFKSEIEQTRSYWKTEFSEDGAVCGSTTINKDGITVTGADDTVGITVIGSTEGLYETRITPVEFSGSYNGEKVFWLNEDETVTRRLYVEKGISLGFIKILPVVQNDIGGIDFLGSNAVLA